MDDTPSDHAEELTVTFYPPLALQRRGWVFDILRREHVSEVSSTRSVYMITHV